MSRKKSKHRKYDRQFFIDQYLRIINIPIIRLDGGVYAKFDRTPRIRDWIKDDNSMWRVENDWNHYHFDQELLDCRVENFKWNRKFAEVGELVWRSKLEELRDHTAEVILVNELTGCAAQLDEDDDTEEIVWYDIFPTLRMWSRTDESHEIEQIYNGYAPDNAQCRDELRYIPLEEALERVRSTQHVKSPFD